MNEFIVWDEELEKFINEKLCLFQDGTLYKHFRDLEDGISRDLTMFWSIGKTDIGDNKIYADSSIVEFDVIYEQGISGDFKTGGGYQKSFKAKGYFTYCSEIACYYINDVQNETRIYLFEIDIENLKITGTLQENKELLK